MTYVKTNWLDGDNITAERLNHLENGILSQETVTTLGDSEINNNSSLVDLITDKAIYNPYERVVWTGWANSNSGKIKVDMYKREMFLGTQYVPFMQNDITWQTYLPGDDKEQYIFKITVITATDISSPQYYAVNVDSSGNNIPIMGFLSKYGEYNPNSQRNIIKKLKRRHINYIQYYDCYERPEHLIRTTLNGEDFQAGTAVDYWKDLSRHQVRADTIREYIRLGKQSGMKNMLYIPWGNTSSTSEYGVTKEMLLYNDGYKSVDGDLSAVSATLSGGDGQWARYSLMQANPGNTAFKDMLFNSSKLALESMGFDGLHIDTLGPNYGNTYTLGGTGYSNEQAAKDMPTFINDANTYLNNDSWKKQGYNIRMSFNNVGSWGASYLGGNNNLDMLYAEQWPDMGNKTYGNMFDKIKELNSFSSFQKVVIPAYMHKDATASSSQFNDNGVIMTDLIIMASGATHLELGEHMLCSEYFPNAGLSMSNYLSTWITNYYDFLVAFGRMLFMKNYTSSVTSPTNTISVNAPRKDQVSVIQQEDDYIQSLSVINTNGLNDDAWRDSNFDRNKPTSISNMRLVLNFKPKAVYCATIENPIPVKLDFDGNNSFVLPTVDRYMLVYAYK